MTPRDETENSAAAILAGARLDGRVVDQLPPDLRLADLDAAYRVQEKVHRQLAAGRFGPRIGWKIACTTRVMQDYLGIPSPCAAGLFAGTRHASAVKLSADAFRRIGIECEIGVRFGRDVPAAASSDPQRIADCIDTVFAAIEIVDDRYADWRQTDTPTLVADDFFAAGCVLGTPIPFGQVPDLATLAGATYVNGTEVGHGIGADVLGHPLNALAFLATSLARRGRQIGAGETVLTGSLVETRWLEAGDAARIEIGGLGGVRLVVTGPAAS